MYNYEKRNCKEEFLRLTNWGNFKISNVDLCCFVSDTLKQLNHPYYDQILMPCKHPCIKHRQSFSGVVLTKHNKKTRNKQAG